MAIHYCHPGARQITQKLAHFYMLITLKHYKAVEKFVKKSLWWKNSFIELTYVVGEHWNCLDETISNECVQKHMLLKLRKPILKFTLNKNHVHLL